MDDSAVEMEIQGKTSGMEKSCPRKKFRQKSIIGKVTVEAKVEQKSVF